MAALLQPCRIWNSCPRHHVPAGAGCFFVRVATKPFEQEGRIRCPSAADRFMFNIPGEFPPPAEEAEIVKGQTSEAASRSSPFCPAEEC